ncbi:MAG: bifunctional (p)ppGpp synthetase/guanosine-3',5'-bis(diphosphate) 3'-pyrophosphohydrolase [Deltaproteobacteria bacterium]|nr:bifunctional (p)ppGpp synthetase/guanosine-3',5'-bis(diphosphate) 3'-pyrophosphohydrolase [Deltaproteobacteria bacterium]
MELLVTHYGGELSEEELDHHIANLERAIQIAKSSHEGQFRKSGEPYFFHPLRVAHLAARNWMDFASITAGFLHDVVEDTPVTLAEVESAFDYEVAFLVNGLTKATDEKLSRETLRTQTYRKQLLVALEDVRVLCLKFWDRIDNLQTIGALDPTKQSLIAEETREIYVPLALHLGMGYVTSELDSLSLRVLYPRRFKRYQIALRAIRREQEGWLRKCRSKISQLFESHKVEALIKDRWRAFSIAAVRALNQGFPKVYTMEINVDKTLDAYLALGLIHSLFPPIPGKLKDYLHIPSQYGFQSLQTTVQAEEYRLRIEITTHKLDRFNRAGILAPGFVFQKANFQDLMRSLLEGESVFDTESLRLASSIIQVYTPRGDVRVLPEGSCALDFGFEIHEELGLHALRARINGKTRLLKSRLLDGDQVDIERADKPQVLPKWLEWAVTPKARNSIRRYLRNRVREEDTADE